MFTLKLPFAPVRAVLRNCSSEAAVFTQTQILKESSVLLFPGQGSQFIGMASKLKHFPKSVDLFERASVILGYDLLKLCLEGPSDKLMRTEISQPAIMVTSLASLEKLENEDPEALRTCNYTAGLSLGEYTSLVFSECLSFEDAIKVVKVRATSMQTASEMTNGGMISIMVNGISNIEECCKAAVEYCHSLGIANPVCQPANYLSSAFQVIGGSIEALEFIEENSSTFGIRKVKRLKVSGAFHTQMMNFACDELKSVLNNVKFNEPKINVISNLTAKPYKNVAEIKDLLVHQVVSPVKWQQTMEYLFNSPSKRNVYELGPGRQLKPLINSSIDGKYRDQHPYYFVEV